MATSCCTLRSTGFGISHSTLYRNPQRRAQVQSQASIVPIGLSPLRLPQEKRTTCSTQPRFASSRRLLGATPLTTATIRVPQKKASTAKGGALSCQAAYPVIFGLAPDTLQWVFTIASTALMFRLLPPVSHALLVPALFLNLPARVVDTMKQEGGAWVAVAVLVLRLFTSLPSYVDLPLAVLLSILVAPYELLRFRGTQAAGIISLAIGIFIAYSHVTANNGVDTTLRSDVLPTTFAIGLILLIPVAFLLGAYV